MFGSLLLLLILNIEMNELFLQLSLRNIRFFEIF
jgi:hypothetical protein